MRTRRGWQDGGARGPGAEEGTGRARFVALRAGAVSGASFPIAWVAAGETAAAGPRRLGLAAPGRARGAVGA